VTCRLYLKLFNRAVPNNVVMEDKKIIMTGGGEILCKETLTKFPTQLTEKITQYICIADGVTYAPYHAIQCISIVREVVDVKVRAFQLICLKCVCETRTSK